MPARPLRRVLSCGSPIQAHSWGGNVQRPWGPASLSTRRSHVEGRCPTGLSSCFQFLIAKHKNLLPAHSCLEEGLERSPSRPGGPRGEGSPGSQPLLTRRGNGECC